MILSPQINTGSMRSDHAERIAMIGNFWFPHRPGGLDRYVYDLIHSLTQLGTEIELFGIDLPDSSANDRLKLMNLAAAQQPTWKRLWQADRLFRALDYSRFSAVNIHFALNALPLLRHLPKSIPVVGTFHGPWAGESAAEGSKKISQFLKQQVEQQVYQRCDRFIVLSQAFGEILHQQFQVPWSKIRVIPGGVDKQGFQITLSRSEARARLNWADDRFILFTPRRLVQRMGIAPLLTAIAQLRTSFPHLWLAIAGKGALQAELQQQASELGLQDHVQFLGFVPDEQLPIAYQAADLTVIPSQSLEGFGLILIESLACGTPVLCTPIGGMPEVLQPFSPGLIADAPAASALADRLRSVLSGELALPARLDCQTYAHTQFDWQRLAPQIRSVLLSVS